MKVSFYFHSKKITDIHFFNGKYSNVKKKGKSPLVLVRINHSRPQPTGCPGSEPEQESLFFPQTVWGLGQANSGMVRGLSTLGDLQKQLLTSTAPIQTEDQGLAMQLRVKAEARPYAARPYPRTQTGKSDGHVSCLTINRGQDWSEDRCGQCSGGGRCWAGLVHPPGGGKPGPGAGEGGPLDPLPRTSRGHKQE